jgi:hypothetical protein
VQERFDGGESRMLRPRGMPHPEQLIKVQS